MRTLSRAIVREEAGGEPLPPVFRTFENYSLSFRRSNLHVLAGLPAAGKTALAMSMVRKWNSLQIPLLYVAMDIDELTMGARFLMNRQQAELKDIERLMRDNREWGADQLADLDHVWWHFDSADLIDVEDMIRAFIEPWGEPPHAVFVDNLIDIDVAGDEQAALRAAAKGLKTIAKDYNTAMILMHHTSEAVEPVKGEDGVKGVCQPRTALWGKDARATSLALTLAYVPGVPGQPGSLFVAPVKNRHARSYPDGLTAYRLQADLDHMTISDVVLPTPRMYDE